MTEPMTTGSGPRRPASSGQYGQRPGSRSEPANLADILERVLDKGIVIAGDIKVNLLDIELLTIKLRLVVASVDRAREMGIDWWEHDPTLSSASSLSASSGSSRSVESSGSSGQDSLAEENRRLRQRLAALEAQSATAEVPTGEAASDAGNDADARIAEERRRE